MISFGSWHQLAWLRLLGGGLLLALLLALCFSAMTWWRLQGLDAESGALIEAGCEGLAPLDLSACINQNLFTWLWQPTWVARTFSLLAVLAALVSWGLLRKESSAPLHGILLGLLSGSILLLMLDPGRLAALCGLFGAWLGGLLADRGQKRGGFFSRISARTSD